MIMSVIVAPNGNPENESNSMTILTLFTVINFYGGAVKYGTNTYTCKW